MIHLSADDTPHIICTGSTVRLYNISQSKFKGEAKIETQPHEGLQARNSLFDGCIFRRGNDGVSLTLTPHLWFGAGRLQTWLAHRGLLHKTERFRSPTSKSIYIHRSLNVNWTHLWLLNKDPRSASRSLLILDGINEMIWRSFLSLLGNAACLHAGPMWKPLCIRRCGRRLPPPTLIEI